MELSQWVLLKTTISGAMPAIRQSLSCRAGPTKTESLPCGYAKVSAIGHPGEANAVVYSIHYFTNGPMEFFAAQNAGLSVSVLLPWFSQRFVHSSRARGKNFENRANQPLRICVREAHRHRGSPRVVYCSRQKLGKSAGAGCQPVRYWLKLPAGPGKTPALVFCVSLNP